MTKRMLIDATQSEETRVAVIEGDRLDSYDFDSSVRKQIKGNIFLAKVTRVEPSLQACFVEYGGNRQGFLAFTEIHPDYYRIPMEDRQALLAEEAELEEDDEDELDGDIGGEMAQPDEAFDEPADDIGFEEQPPASYDDAHDNSLAAIPAEAVQPEVITSEVNGEINGDNGDAPVAANLTEVERDNTVDSVGGAEEDTGQRTRQRRQGRLRKRYKIQEVIKRRQIMLVQATKEERGQKGAAMTTYISLPGRYCVLMPNSPRGGGISRKITDARSRRKMKELLAELDVPQGMSVILRTAGMTRTRAEVKRDLEYLLKLWDEIRRETMQSVAPALIYEEADVFKRSIRDLYNRDTTEIIVAGEAGYKKVKSFMYQMVPAHAQRVKFYRDPKVPLFQRFGIEQQIADIFNPRVELKSGGYIIINPTEALVSIDVNSGRATRERNVDDMALKTNLEAASEVARQLRLRDLGGLVVVDFIDMESNRHNAKVERRMREAMAIDRARIEIGRISGFGLLELSRQRLHPSLTETHFEPCEHCLGTGLVRTIESAAVVVMRAIEAEAVKGRAIHIVAKVPQQVMVYIMNHKREEMNRVEDYFGCRVSLKVDEALALNEMDIQFEKGSPVPRKHIEELPIPFIEGVDDQPVVEEEPDDEPMMGDDENSEGEERGDREDRGGRGDRGDRGEGRSRRSRRGGRNRNRGDNRGDRTGGNRRAQQNGEMNAEGGDVVNIPITDGSPEDAFDGEGQNTNGQPQEGRENNNNGERGGRNNRRRRNRRGRHPYHRGREGREDNRGDGRAPQAADAPASEPANIVTSRPEPAPVAAEGNGGEKRGWWQKLME